MTADVLWTLDEMAKAMGARREGALPASVSGLSIDTRTLKQGEAFFAITGEHRDGHEFVEEAFVRGAALAVVAEDKRAAFSSDARLLVVPDVLDALRSLARAARARSNAKIVGVTGSVGKTGTKEMLRLVLSKFGETHASTASFNNHWGVPLSLARMPASARFGVFEIGMNHAGEITPLTRLVRPHVAIITAVEAVHLEFFGSVEGIADAKAEIFLGLEPGGTAVINRDNPHYERLRMRAKEAGVERIVSFGENGEADTRLIDVSLRPDGSAVSASILGADVTYKIGAPGRHLVLNSLAVLTAASLLDADLAVAALALAAVKPASGRGEQHVLHAPGGTVLLIDESYNANPASMRAALALLGQASIEKGGRRIAVLGDMLELGPMGPKLHRDLLDEIFANAIDLVFAAGPLMRSLWDALPAERRGGYAENSAALEPEVLTAVRAGDAVMVKGSLGSRMGPIVLALRTRAPQDARSRAAARG